MADFYSDREEKLKQAFSKIKEEINSIRSDFEALKAVIAKQQELLEVFLSKIAQKSQENHNFEGFSGIPLEASTGNKGVQTNKQTNTQTNKQTHLKQTNNQIPILSSIKKDVLSKFQNLPKREFLIFLTIYQLEEDKGSVSYSDIANHLKLSESGIRHYVFNIIKRGLPVQKKKINNKMTVLSISPEFKEINIKKELADLYLHQDSAQKTLTDEY
ncbi:MAG: hypothetical protein QW404_03320 [Candidatus Nanoarchaeia archaeon]